MLHVADYPRAIGEFLELDHTINSTYKVLQRLGIENDTLIVVTADHAHGFDIFGSVDTLFLTNQTDARSKRNAVGPYERSGSFTGDQQYVSADSNTGYPTNWQPRYAMAAGLVAHPDITENFKLVENVTTTGGARLPAVLANSTYGYVANPSDSPGGFVVNGTLPVSYPQGVHSLMDVAVYAMGPGSELFRGYQSSIQIFQRLVGAMQL